MINSPVFDSLLRLHSYAILTTDNCTETEADINDSSTSVQDYSKFLNVYIKLCI